MDSFLFIKKPHSITREQGLATCSTRATHALPPSKRFEWLAGGRDQDAVLIQGATLCANVCVHTFGLVHIYLTLLFFSNRVVGRFPRRKSVRASALQSHLEFIGQPNPGSCLFFPL